MQRSNAWCSSPQGLLLAATRDLAPPSPHHGSCGASAEVTSSAAASDSPESFITARCAAEVVMGELCGCDAAALLLQRRFAVLSRVRGKPLFANTWARMRSK
jgi:hypothetical protein